MKTILLAAALAACTGAARAQFVEIGIHGGAGSTWLLNSNVSDQDDRVDYAASFGPIYGLQLGVFGNSGAGVVLEINGTTAQQRYQGDVDLSLDPNQPLTGRYRVVEAARYVEVPVLFRKYFRSGFFFELGPKISILQRAESSLEITEAPAAALLPFVPQTLYEDLNVTTGFRDNVYSGVLGLGGAWEVNRGLYFNARVRFAYGFSDATRQYSQTQLGSVQEDIGYATTLAHYRQDQSYGYEKTTLATGHIMLGFTYRVR